MRFTKAMRDQLKHVAHLSPIGGASTSGCGNGDFNRYMRLLDAGFVKWGERGTFLVITPAGIAQLNKEP